MQAMIEQCCQMVASKGTMRHRRCQRRGLHDHEGKAYCSIHDPIVRRAKYEKRNAEFRAASARRSARWEYETACVDFVERLGGSNAHVMIKSLDDAKRRARRIVASKPQ